MQFITMSNSTSTITATFLDQVRDRWPIVATVVGSLAVAWIVQFFLRNDPLSTIPKIKSGGRWLPFADPAAYVNGYKKVSHSVKNRSYACMH
jgi:hypothetical protein